MNAMYGVLADSIERPPLSRNMPKNVKPDPRPGAMAANFPIADGKCEIWRKIQTRNGLGKSPMQSAVRTPIHTDCYRRETVQIV